MGRAVGVIERVAFLLFGVFAGAAAGIVIFGALTRRRAVRWTVECGRCHTEREAGPRRQLYLEVWDSYGNMYEKFPVGAGELLSTRQVDAALMMDVRQLVGRINAQAEAPEAPEPRMGSGRSGNV